MKNCPRCNREYITDHDICDECIHELQIEEEQNRMVQVTKEMAYDAGFPEMEGQWIKW